MKTLLKNLNIMPVEVKTLSNGIKVMIYKNGNIKTTINE